MRLVPPTDHPIDVWVVVYDQFGREVRREKIDPDPDGSYVARVALAPGETSSLFWEE